MLFPKLNYESVLTVKDKTRFNASRSYVSKDEIDLTIVRIDPGDGSGFIDVFDTNSKNWYLDYEYATDGAKTVTVEVDNGSGPVTSSFTVNVLSVADDALFSNDDDLQSIETDIINYLPDGKSSFNYAHREAQKEILEYFNKIGIRDTSGGRLTKAAVLDIDEVRFWSKYLTYRIIFNDLSKQPGDIYELRSQKYMADENEWRHSSRVRLDINGDNVLDSQEGVDITWRRLDRV